MYPKKITVISDIFKHFLGGIFLTNNPLRCNCHLTWFSHWLRQWMKQSQPTQNYPIENILRLDDMIEESTCIDESTGSPMPIVHLLENNLDCHASALSDATNSSSMNALLIASFIIYFHYQYLVKYLEKGQFQNQRIKQPTEIFSKKSYAYKQNLICLHISNKVHLSSKSSTIYTFHSIEDKLI